MRTACIVLAFVCLSLVGELALARHSSLGEWAQFKRRHGKAYGDPAEEALRFSLFQAAKARVDQHNADPSHGYKLGLNHMSDWTDEERAKLNGLRLNAARQQHDREPAAVDPFLRAILDDPTPVPDELDWRKVPNRVGPVKDQGWCASSWTFATTGLLEGQEVLRNRSIHSLIPLSEQEIIDCSKKNYGCLRGDVESALEDIAKLGGLESEQAYQYKAVEGSCKYDRSKVVVAESGALDLPYNDEWALKKVVAKYGPVATFLQASHTFVLYKSGIFYDNNCDFGAPHPVLVVGYGTDEDAGDYWIAKNCWGSDWGEEGYFRIKRGCLMCAFGTASTIAKFD